MKGLLSAPLSSRKLVEYPLLFLLLASVLSAAAYGGYWYGKQQVKPSPTAAPKAKEPTPPKAADETAGWETYVNRKFGYSLGYPKGWFYLGEDPNGEVNFSNKNVRAPLEMGNDGIWVAVSTLQDTREIATVASCEVNKPCEVKKTLAQDGGEVNSGYTRQESLEVNGNSIIKYFVWQSPVGTTASGDHIFDRLTAAVQKDGTVIRIELITLGKKPSEDQVELFDQILSTFRFLDQR